MKPDGPVAAGATPGAGGRLLALSPERARGLRRGERRSVVGRHRRRGQRRAKLVARLDLARSPSSPWPPPARLTLAIVHAGDVELLDVSSPLHPVRGAPRPFRRGPRRADRRRRSRRRRKTWPRRCRCRPTCAMSVIADGAFSPDGRHAVIATVTRSAARAMRPAATQVFAARVDEAPP